MDVIDQIFAAFGNSPTTLSRATGIPVQTVFDWRAKTPRNIPHWRRAVVMSALKRMDAQVSDDVLAYLLVSESAAA